jgi:ribose transport system permease protein
MVTIAGVLGVVAAGQNLVILSGGEGIDLSVGGIVSFGAFLAGNLMQQSDANILPAVAAVFAATFAIGLCNGLGVTVLRVPPLVMTLGMFGVLQGGLVLLTRGIPSGSAAPLLRAAVTSPLLLGLPGIVFIWALLGVALTLMLRRTTFGLNLYAIGANERTAAVAGVAVPRVRVLAFGFSGLLAGVGGILLLGYTGNVFVGAGDQYALPSMLQSVLTTLSIPEFGRQVIYGLTLLALMLIYGRQRRLRG